MVYLIPEIIFSLGILGALLIWAIVLVFNGFYKYSGIITFPVMVLIGVDYFSYYSTSNSVLIWLAYLSWIVALICLFQIVVRKR